MSTITIPLAEFDAANSTEDEINRTYKERFRLIAEQLETDLFGIPHEIVSALQERGRLDWIAHEMGAEAQARRLTQLARVAEQVNRLESLGVSDKAPPRRGEPRPLADAAPMVDAAARGTVAAAREPDPGAGAAADVDRAMRGLFGSSMEDD